jgi:hypothetical protein
MMAAEGLPNVLAIPFRTSRPSALALWLTVMVSLSLFGTVALVRGVPALVLAAGAYVTLLLLWPYVLLRYLVPIIPAFLILLLVGARAIGEQVRPRSEWFKYACPGALAFALIAAALAQDAAKWRAVAACDRARAASSRACFSESPHDYFAAVAAVRGLPDDSANFLVSKEALFHVLTGRYAAWEAEASEIRDSAALADYLRRQQVSYVLLSQTNLNQWSLAKPLTGLCPRLRVIRQFGRKVSLLRIVDEGAPGANACPQVSAWSAPPWPEGRPLIW